MGKRMVDLFCREGGATAGYVRAGWEVHGVDLGNHERRYLRSGGARYFRTDATTFDVSGYDMVRYSPPCEDHSVTMAFGMADRGTGWLLPWAVAHAETLDVPWEIENVDSPATRALMPGAFMLCGSAWELGAHDSGGQWRTLRRHRLFLTSFPATPPPCTCRGRLVGGVYGHGEQSGRRGYGFAAAAAREAMGTPWMTRDGCAEAIPPAYTEWIASQLDR